MNALVLASLAALSLSAADRSPHPLVKPYEGSTVDKPLEVSRFAQVELLLPREGERGLSPRSVEGEVVQARYRGPADRSPLEVFRNYQQALERAGYQVQVSCIAEQCGAGLRSPLFGYLSARGSHYLVARGKADGKDTWVALRLFERQAHIVSVQAGGMESDKVQVTAAQLQEGLEQSGHVAVYGILFDTGKAELKPESEPVLAQISQLLKQQPKLRLHVVGHTDNVGGFEQNLDLSRRRAEAVVKSLVTRHGAAAARLRAFGASSAVPVESNRSEAGRAKNRRVELVEQ